MTKPAEATLGDISLNRLRFVSDVLSPVTIYPKQTN